MQYGDLPLFILLLAAIYLTTIYGILKVAKKLAQKRIYLNALAVTEQKSSLQV